eukprot:COSAG02_NODE_342_length_24167_cov_5.061118_2_plen_181_part_00
MERCTGKISPCVRIATSAQGMSSTSGKRHAGNDLACSADSLCDTSCVNALRHCRSIRRNYGLGDNDFGSYHFHRADNSAPRAGLESGKQATVRSVWFASNHDGDRNCHSRPDPPWFPGDEDSVSVQRAVHALFKMPLTGAAFAGCCFALPGRGETEWLQVRTPEMIFSHPSEIPFLPKHM